jgi:hypothetical protein
MARWAHDACEALLDDATIDEAAEAALDMTRQSEAMRRSISRVLQHGLEVIGDHTVERRGLGSARMVAAWQWTRRGPWSSFEHVIGPVT